MYICDTIKLKIMGVRNIDSSAQNGNINTDQNTLNWMYLPTWRHKEINYCKCV